MFLSNDTLILIKINKKVVLYYKNKIIILPEMGISHIKMYLNNPYSKNLSLAPRLYKLLSSLSTKVKCP